MNWPAYKAYRETGHQWLGRVPEHWETRPLGFHFSERKTTVSDTDFAPLSVTKDGIVPQLETAAKTDNPENRKLVLAGDFVINSRSDRKGSAGIAERDGSVSVISTVLEPRDIEASFVHHLLRSEAFQEEYYRFGSGIVADLWSTRYSAMKQITLAVPSRDEQRSIARFLDRETAKIDALISKQEQLIATLLEDRTATITHAVTQGLDPAVEMATSEFPGLRTVPSGWALTPLKHVCFVRDCKHVTAEFVADGFPLASIREVQSRYVDVSDAKKTTEAFYNLLNEGGRRPQAGDLIFSRNATVGEVAEVPNGSVPFAMGQDVCLLRPDSQELDPGYAWYVLRSGLVRTQIDLMMIGSTFKRINVEEIRSLVITLPPKPEQQAIVDFLEKRCAKIDALIDKANEVIETMREYRSALTTAAVTGKIDVRKTV